MTDRQQNVAPRARRPSPRPPSRTAAPRRRRIDVARWLRRTLVAALVALPFAGYYAAAGSEVFALKHVEVVGATRTPVERIEQVVRSTAGSRLLRADLDAVRRAVEAERSVQSASVVRLLPDTIRVRVEEREPAVVVRLSSGRLAWADLKGHVVADFQPEGDQIPPPLTGFEDRDQSERAAADNRDRIATYLAVRDALAEDKLWDWLDEVDVRYLRDVQVRLVESGIMVRLGNDRYRDRLAKALRLIDAARRGDAEALAGMGLPEAYVDRVMASPDLIGQIDAAQSSNRLSIAFLKAGSQDARRN
jgi:cell division septal protein FtsQ